jgi:hypothetical protein
MIVLLKATRYLSTCSISTRYLCGGETPYLHVRLAHVTLVVRACKRNTASHDNLFAKTRYKVPSVEAEN